jgi:hypothetical protein
VITCPKSCGSKMYHRLNRMITRVKRFSKKFDNASKKIGTWTKKTKEVEFVTPP